MRVAPKSTVVHVAQLPVWTKTDGRMDGVWLRWMVRMVRSGKASAAVRKWSSTNWIHYIPRKEM